MASLFSRTLALGLAGAAALTLGGCYDDGYGYGGVEAGVGYYGDGYGYGGAYAGGAYGYGYGDPYYGGYPAYGWFDGFYYPGSGLYVYDRGGHRFHMRDRDRDHWNGPRQGQAGNGQWQGRGGPGNGQWNGRGGPGNGQWQGGGSGATPQDWAARRQAWQQGRAAQSGQAGQTGQGLSAEPQRGRSYAPQPSRGDYGGRTRGRSRQPQ